MKMDLIVFRLLNIINNITSKHLLRHLKISLSLLNIINNITSKHAEEELRSKGSLLNIINNITSKPTLKHNKIY